MRDAAAKICTARLHSYCYCDAKFPARVVSALYLEVSCSGDIVREKDTRNNSIYLQRRRVLTAGSACALLFNAQASRDQALLLGVTFDPWVCGGVA